MKITREDILKIKPGSSAQDTLKCYRACDSRGLLLIELHWQTQGRMWRGIKYPLIRRRGN